MRIRNVSLLSIALCFLLAACQEEKKEGSTNAIKNDGSVTIPEKDKTKEVSDCILEPTAGLLSVRLNEPIAKLRERLPTGFTMEASKLQMADGTFDVYQLTASTGEMVTIYPMEDKGGEKVHQIEYKGTACTTAKGIKVGSTWSEVLLAYPGATARGSEIEGRTTAKAGGFTLLLDGNYFSPDLDQKTLPQDMKVKAILLQ